MERSGRTRSAADDARLAAFERRMAMPITVAALLPIVFSMAGRDSILSDVVMVVTWFVFVADLVVHVRLVPRYLRSGQGIFDLAVVVLTAPWFFLPGFGDARYASVARLARLARIVRAGGTGLRNLAAQLGQVGLFTVGLVFTCAYVAYGQERAVNDSFADFGDALWWATVTITTVGYGDIFPVTSTGRFVAVVLMFAGLGVLGVIAGALASFFGLGDDDAEPAGASPDAVAADLVAQVAALREQVAVLDRALVAVLEQPPSSSAEEPS